MPSRHAYSVSAAPFCLLFGKPLAINATSVRFLAPNFFMMRRTCTFTVLSHISSSRAINLLALPRAIASTTAA